jgi:hypothetical protein
MPVLVPAGGDPTVADAILGRLEFAGKSLRDPKNLPDRV